MISTRRFCCRPAAVPFVATGRLSPKPDRRDDRTCRCPVDRSRPRTDSARRSDSRWLCSSAPVLSACPSISIFRSGCDAEDAGDPRQLLARARLQRRLVHVEQHVGQVDDEPARGFARLEDDDSAAAAAARERRRDPSRPALSPAAPPTRLRRSGRRAASLRPPAACAAARARIGIRSGTLEIRPRTFRCEAFALRGGPRRFRLGALTFGQSPAHARRAARSSSA